MTRRLKNIYHWLIAFLATVYYHFPSKKLKIIGVTGTDGKTTTVTLIAHILSKAGFNADSISTVSAPGLHTTTPNSFAVQRFLRKAVNQKKKYIVLETTSHGLDQHRLAGINFLAAVITNITHEHLDYHQTFQNYLAVKAKLFKKVKIAVLNRDDESYKYLDTKIQRYKDTKIVTYGIKKEADFTPQKFKFTTSLPGDYNQYNCLAAIAVCAFLGISAAEIKKAVASFKGVKGRMEEIKEGQDFKVFVDFAHTPAAFEKVIPTVRKMTRGEVIHVFGCTGNRDKSKRSIMGRIAAQLDDKVILTHEDTYREDPEKIIAEIEPGVEKEGKILGKTYWKISNRHQAIKKAISMAEKGDAVLITGVGHQTSLNLGGHEVSWSDQKEVKEAIKEKRSA